MPPLSRLLSPALLVATTLGLPHVALAANGHVSITKNGGNICMISNGLPNHSTGRFPNRGNPNSIHAQNIKVCVPQNPKKGSQAKFVRGSIGFALNGVMIRPGTADFYDASSRRGFSRQGNRNWRLEGMGAHELLGMDANNAHVDERGLYHYHGKPTGFLSGNNSTLVGYAADGFEIHYAGSSVISGYSLVAGIRKDGPGGRHDGTYEQDWQFTGGSGKLDQCNGGMLNGQFVYFVTDSYPYVPRCLWGKVSSGFGR